MAKVKEIKSKCKQALREKKLSVRQLAHIIGVLLSTHLAVLPAPLHYRGLQAQKIKGLLRLSYDSNNNLGGTESDGLELVDQQFGEQQWMFNSPGSARDDNRVGCVQYRLGGLLEQCEDGFSGHSNNLSFTSMQRS